MEKLPEKKKSEFDKLMNRREVLRSVGKFSAIAALALSGSSLLLNACKKSTNTEIIGPDTEPSPDGSSIEKAIQIDFGDSAEATIRASDGMVKYYKFIAIQNYDLSLVNILAVSFVGGTIVRCTILNSNLEEWDYQDFDDLATVDFSAETGTWYIKFEALQGGGIITFRLAVGTPGTWDNYNDWNNYSDAWNNYSDTWSNYSDAWTNYSDSWSNYSDSWSNYSDYGAWGNWIQSW